LINIYTNYILKSSLLLSFKKEALACCSIASWWDAQGHPTLLGSCSFYPAVAAMRLRRSA
jgi:hypothetical protein